MYQNKGCLYIPQKAGVEVASALNKHEAKMYGQMDM
jgi:hypothetical protein